MDKKAFLTKLESYSIKLLDVAGGTASKAVFFPEKDLTIEQRQTLLNASKHCYEADQLITKLIWTINHPGEKVPYPVKREPHQESK